ncbi:hypothetical protein [Pseudoduganella armeniaca]|uniref:Lipoprotein n=1 Tax=Pseudoduganella armeniaca TaxID=2072590 RepID=A0A2R4C3Y8_9BURK|nr:hypothetical protein [Pseudoduganella armeniaca]AVR94294.1 hypothetical protein C9I28_00150 [Pseudoduganella armeniaca]
MRTFITALAVPLLAGCYNDSATYYVDSTQDHRLTVRRQQDYFWSEEGRFTLMAARMPACQRAIPLGELPLEDTKLELFSEGNDRWSLRAGKQVWHVDTQQCALVEDGAAAAGQKLGDFLAEIDQFTFVEAAEGK